MAILKRARRRRHAIRPRLATLVAIAAALIAIAASCTLLAQTAQRAPPPTTAPTEYQVKAVFLFNFAQFIEWPPEAFAAPDTPLSICVLAFDGRDPFGPALDDAVRGETVAGRKLTVERHTAIDTATTCHILFVPAAHAAEIDGLVELTRPHHSLIVTDGPPHTATIAFVKERHRLRLRVNLAAANAAGLTISSKLLRIADVVGPRPVKR